jgi:hypothetical protein
LPLKPGNEEEQPEKPVKKSTRAVGGTTP